jgi:hypothetical protein
MAEQHDEVTRLCPHCREQIFRRDEVRGRCPHCGGTLLLLSGRWESWDWDTTESIEAEAGNGEVSEDE